MAEIDLNRIKEWRKAQGYSMEQAALALGVTSSTLFRWEHGKSKPRGLSRAALIRAMNQQPGN